MENVATSELHQVFCDNVKSRRKELGLTQTQVAERLGMTQGAYASIESGRKSPTLDAIARVCRALECNASEMLASQCVEV